MDVQESRRPILLLLSAIVLISWLAFLFADSVFLQTVDPTRRNGYSEIYGPASFFQPLLKYVTFFLTLVYLAVCNSQGNKRSQNNLRQTP